MIGWVCIRANKKRHRLGARLIANVLDRCHHLEWLANWNRIGYFSDRYRKRRRFDGVGVGVAFDRVLDLLACQYRPVGCRPKFDGERRIRLEGRFNVEFDGLDRFIGVKGTGDINLRLRLALTTSHRKHKRLGRTRLLNGECRPITRLIGDSKQWLSHVSGEYRHCRLLEHRFASLIDVRLVL